MTYPVTEDPVTVTTKGTGRDETRTTHPAYAQVAAHRVSGHMNLYDSEFSHNHFMTISIKTSECVRSLSHDRHYPNEELIEIAMSEQQWASFVSSPNANGGTPCTINRLAGKSVPRLPNPTPPEEKFRSEVAADLDDTLVALTELDTLIDTLGLSKGKAEQLRAQGRTIRSKITSAIPFVASQFDEHMANTVEKAKAEVHGYMTGTLTRAGLTALGGSMPLVLTDRSDEA